MDWYAGKKKAPASPKIAARTIRCQSASRFSQPSTATRATATPRTVSDQSSTLRREKRSATTPPSKRKRTRGSVCAISTTPIAVPDPVSTSTCHASAVSVTPSPSDEIVWPDQTSAKGFDPSARANRTRRTSDGLLTTASHLSYLRVSQRRDSGGSHPAAGRASLAG